uniref:Uncharacterized protein n=1 Tax=Haemonchus contortus TaxID=6289 RepID=A0A7I4YDR5_HAECO
MKIPATCAEYVRSNGARNGAPVVPFGQLKGRPSARSSAGKGTVRCSMLELPRGNGLLPLCDDCTVPSSPSSSSQPPTLRRLLERIDVNAIDVTPVVP